VGGRSRSIAPTRWPSGLLSRFTSPREKCDQPRRARGCGSNGQRCADIEEPGVFRGFSAGTPYQPVAALRQQGISERRSAGAPDSKMLRRTRQRAGCRGFLMQSDCRHAGARLRCRCDMVPTMHCGSGRAAQKIRAAKAAPANGTHGAGAAACQPSCGTQTAPNASKPVTPRFAKQVSGPGAPAPVVSRTPRYCICEC